MKTKIGRRAKSALSILLTLCMILSVFTVGVASASAATADSESVGYSAHFYLIGTGTPVGAWAKNDNYKIESDYATNKWYINAKFTKNGFFALHNGTDQYGPGTDQTGITVGGSWTKDISEYQKSKSWKFTGDTQMARLVVDESSSEWYPNISMETIDWYMGGWIEGSEQAVATNAWKFSKVSNTSYTKTFTSTGATQYVTINDGKKCVYHPASNNSGTGTAASSITGTDKNNSDPKWKIESTENYLVTVKWDPTTQTLSWSEEAPITTLDTPTNVKINNATTYAVNAGDSGTTTLTWTAVANASGYTIYKDGTQVATTTGTSYTLSNTTASAGAYTVKATTTDTATYADSAVSSAATFNVYEPQYCLIGNDLDAILVNGSTVSYDTKTGYNDLWQDNLIVATPTATPGKYSFTFKVKEKADYEWDVQVGIRHKTDGQKGFIYNGTAYNTASADLAVPDAGISSGLFAYQLAATSAGGSLFLKQGQTYTITIDQTQRYDTSSPYGKITITTTDAFIDTVAKKEDFNATNRAYDSAADASESIGTVSAAPYHGAKGYTATLTATTVNNNYTFKGWFDNEACTGTAVNTNATFNVTASESKTYYALFRQAMPADYQVTATNPTGGAISFTDGVEGSNAYAGAVVTMSLNVSDRSKEFKNWKITSAAGVDITSSVLNSGATAASASFTMPAYNVIVTAELGNKTPVSITTSSSDTALGTAAYTPGTYYVGEEITIKATNVGGVFSRWQINGANYKSGYSATSQTAVIIPTGTTVTAKAIFDYKTYQLFSDKDILGNVTSEMYTLVRQSDGTYVSTRTVDKNTGSFTIYDVTADKYARPSTTEDYEMHSGYTSNNINSWYSSDKKYKIKNSDSAKYYVVFDPSKGSAGSVTITTTNPMGDIAQIYAKDGSIRYYDSGKDSGDLWESGTGGTTANRGVTVVTQINSSSVANPDGKRYSSTNQSEHLKIYSAAIGSTITIETTVNSTYKTQGFYVGMFVVNGWKVNATDVGNGTYRATYTLSDEYDVENLDKQKSFEITPVYYNNNFEYITFYVDAKSVPSEWGSTISACANYNGAAWAHFEGTYPGQPLGREGNLYELKVAKYYYSYESNKWKAQTNYHPAATITAYNFDLVHHYYYVNKSEDIYSDGTNKNLQTYDYADFAYLSQIKDIEAVLFRCMKETSKSNRDYCAIDRNRPSDNEVNPYKLLTDYYGNPIDALGNRLTGDALANALSSSPTAQIKIVSCGNISNDNKKSTDAQDVAYQSWRTTGNWITAWKVFKADTWATHIAVGSPADFVNTKANTTDTPVYNFSYASGKSSADLANKVTFISYEKELQNDGTVSGDSGNTGVRIDGQWYYSAKHEFDSNVKVAITTTDKNDDASISASGITTIDDDSSAANTNNGWDGTLSKTTATLDGKTVATYSSTTTEAKLNCSLGAGYIFVGWYLYDGTNYTKVHDNFTDQNTTMTMKMNYTIVAVVRQVGASDLVITHSRYTGSHPEAHEGTGKYYVSAVINRNGGTTETIAEAQNNITVSDLAENDTITITLRTVCDGADTFYAWYEEALNEDYTGTGNYYEICDENVDPMGESEVSYTFFAADGKYLQGRKTLDFYSDILHVSAYATLTYKYFDRYEDAGKNQMVSYVVRNVPLTTEEIEAGYIPSDEKIAKYAPDVVDTIKLDTKWNIVGTKVQRQASNVTLMATQTEKTCFVEYLLNDSVESNLFTNRGPQAVEDVAAWNTRIVPYNSWLIDENADLDNPQESDFYVSAPSTINKDGKTWSFVRFDVYRFDRKTGNIGDVLYSSNDNTFGYRIYADCVIYPVYQEGAASKQLTAKIEPAVLNREVYGEAASLTDKLYADLLVSYINIAAATGGEVPEVIRELDEESPYTVETGVILDNSQSLSTADFNTLKTAATATPQGTDTTAAILKNYTNYIAKTSVEALAQYGTKTTGLTKIVNNNASLTNKNRIDRVIRFSNTENVQKKVYAAYSYVTIKKDGNLIACAVSEQPQLFNFAYIGNEPLATVSE